jgi:2-keto-4-pentenoate hydratase/2-oxohepta-3-ene-1,7-dioic acid hydratase in catechol pathway
MSTYKLLSYQINKEARAGVLVGDTVYDVQKVTATAAYATVMGILAHWAQAKKALAEFERKISTGKSRIQGTPLKKTKLLSPVLYPGDMYCAGANYTDHMQEMARVMNQPPGPNMKEMGEKPWHFMKSTRASIVGPGAKVKIPPYSKAMDWEIELVAVIGKVAKNVSVEKALSYVAGYTIADDLSARDMMKRPKIPQSAPFHIDWIGQKCFDGACPVGPWIVPSDQIKNPHKLGLKLWVNDVLMQDSNTSKLIFDTAEQIAALSERVTLYPGDLILTGTPAGVGMGRQLFLKPGDVVKMWIEDIGELTHSMA